MPISTRSLRASCLVPLALALLALPSEASNGPMPQTMGTRGPVALPVDGDGFTFHRMPSSIAWTLDDRVDLDYFLFWSKAVMKNNLNDFESSGTTNGGAGGLVLAFGRPNFEEDTEEAEEYSDAKKFTLGFGIFPEMAGGGGKSNVRYETFPEGVDVAKGILFVSATLAGSYTVTDWFAPGIGLHAVYADLTLRSTVGGTNSSLNGSPQIADGVNFPGNPTYAEFLELFSSTGSSDPSTFFKSDLTSIQFAATISLSFRPLDNLGIGISYRPRSWDPLHFTGKATVDAGRTITRLDSLTQTLLLATLPGGGSEFAAGDYASEYDVELYGIRTPRQIRASAVFWPVDWLLISAEVAWIEWHRAFRRVVVKLEDGDNSDLNFVVGSNQLQSIIVNNWHNTWVGSAQVAVSPLNWLTLRMGLNVGKTPFNNRQQGNGPNSGLSEVNLGWGAGFRYQRENGDLFEFNFYFEHSFHDSQHSGDWPEEKTAKFTFYSAKQWFFHFGASYRF